MSAFQEFIRTTSAQNVLQNIGFKDNNKIKEKKLSAVKPRDEAFLRTTAPRIATTEMVSEALNKMIADAPKNSAKREKAKRAAEAKIESARRAIQTGEIGKIPTNLERFLQIRGVNVNNFERAIKGGLLPNFLSLWSDGNKFFAGLQTANGLRVMTLRTLMGLNSVRTPGRVGLSNTDQAFIIQKHPLLKFLVKYERAKNALISLKSVIRAMVNPETAKQATINRVLLAKGELGARQQTGAQAVMTAFGRTIGKQLLDDARQGIRRQPGPGQGGGGLSRTRNGNGNGPGLSIEVSQDTIQDIGNLILGAINDGVSLTMTIDNVSRDVTNFSDNDIRTIINANRGKQAIFTRPNEEGVVQRVATIRLV